MEIQLSIITQSPVSRMKVRKLALYLDDDAYEAVNKICKQTLFLGSRERYVEILDATYVFVSPRTGSHYHRTAPNDWLKDLWKKDGIKLKKLGLHYISPHGFRHSQASMLFELDVTHRMRSTACGIKTSRLRWIFIPIYPRNKNARPYIN